MEYKGFRDLRAELQHLKQGQAHQAMRRNRDFLQKSTEVQREILLEIRLYQINLRKLGIDT